MFDLGDPVPLSVQVKDSTGALANAGAITLTITLPDGTSATPTVSNPSTGVYTASYATTQAGHHAVRWVATGLNASAFTDAFEVDVAAPSGLVSLAEVRAHLEFRNPDTANAKDEELRRYIDAATDFIESRIGPVVRRTITEVVRPASGILFMSGPVISVTSITDTYGYGSTYNVANFLPDGSAIYPLANVATVSYPVTVTYVGGRAVIPALIRQAALDYVKWMWDSSQRGPTSLPVEDFGVQPQATVPFRILQALEPYMSPVVA